MSKAELIHRYPTPALASDTAPNVGGEVPPLRGDGKGNYRVHIVGNSGIFTTLARELAALLRVPHVNVDTILWQPGWVKLPPDEIRGRVRAVLDTNPRGWVIDGNYYSVLGSIVSERETDVIWLDPPLLLYFPRLCWRTFLRLVRLEPPCSPGCQESAREVFFSRDSIVWWCLSRHWLVRKRQAALYAIDGIHIGGKVRRIGGWGGELAAWKRDVKALLESAME
ncbi:hypothetical protein C8Q70DRAFT_911876 [Cubamyces menziesii]|nr:hypothetical protein C8Q70DRAFT_911876 [Cubamyces menziesii]